MVGIVLAWLAGFAVMMIGHLLGIDPTVREQVLMIAAIVAFWWVAETVGP